MIMKGEFVFFFLKKKYQRKLVKTNEINGLTKYYKKNANYIG